MVLASVDGRGSSSSSSSVGGDDAHQRQLRRLAAVEAGAVSRIPITAPPLTPVTATITTELASREEERRRGGRMGVNHA